MIPSIEDRRRDAEFMARLAARIEEDMSLLTKLGKVTSPRDAIKAEIVAIWDESDAERKRLDGECKNLAMLVARLARRADEKHREQAYEYLRSIGRMPGVGLRTETER